jgi:hypothetical protein
MINMPKSAGPLAKLLQRELVRYTRADELSVIGAMSLGLGVEAVDPCRDRPRSTGGLVQAVPCRSG